jgi:hypothetical protein
MIKNQDVRIRKVLPAYPNWVRDAACAKYSIAFADAHFFAHRNSEEKIEIAKEICHSCPVIVQCYQMNKDIPAGIFYGMTAIERWRMKTGNPIPVTKEEKEREWHRFDDYLKTFPY